MTELLTPIQSWDPDALVDAFDELQDALSKTVAALALSGLSAMLFRTELDAVVDETPLRDTPWLVSDLLGGEIPGDLVDLSRRVLSMVELVRARPKLRALLSPSADAASGPVEARSASLESIAVRLVGVRDRRRSDVNASADTLDEDERALADALAATVVAHPAACSGALTLEAPRFAERPELVLAMVARLVDTDVHSGTLELLARAASGARKKAEYALETGGGTGSWLRGSVKKRLTVALEGVRVHGRDTALLFLPAERVVDRLRSVALALGERLFEHGLLDQPRDVLHLTAREIAGLVRGTGVDFDGKPLVAARKRQAAARPTGLARRLETKGVVAGARLDDDDEPQVTSPGEAKELMGRPVSARVIEAPAMLLHPPKPPTAAVRATPLGGATPAAPPRGVVLVKQLALQDLPLFLAAQAVVAERGTPWGAAAYALRALGIPTVVDAPQATAVFGGRQALGVAGDDLVRVDGGKGVVARVPSAGGAGAASGGAGGAFARAPAAGFPTPARIDARGPATDTDVDAGLLFARAAVLSDPRARIKADRPAPALDELPPPPLVRPSEPRVGPSSPSVPSGELARPAKSSPIAVGNVAAEETDIEDGDILMSTDLEGSSDT